MIRCARSIRFPAAFLLGSIAASAPAGAIVGGVVDSTHTAVAAVFDNSVSALCSGVLIAPTVVLTAAGCLSGDPTAANWLVGVDTNALSGGATFLAVSDLHVHPSFNPGPLDHNVGVLILGAPAPVAPMPWLDSDPGGVYTVGAGFLAAGYGGTSSLGGEGTRRSVGLDITEFTAGTFTHTGTSAAQACSGDSGGPAIEPLGAGLVETVVGTVSYGDQSCASFSVFDRTDAESSFIAQFAPEPGAWASAVAALASLAVATRVRA